MILFSCFFDALFYNGISQLQQYRYCLRVWYSTRVCWSMAAWPAWVPLICDMLRQWQCVWRVWLYTPQTLCMAKCYWIVYCHKSQTFQWLGATTIHSLIHPSSCSALSDVLVYWALRSVTSASWAGDFKRSTCLSISSAPLSQPSPGSWERERERERRRDAEGKGNLVASVLRSVLDTACGTGLEDASCPPFKLRI